MAQFLNKDRERERERYDAKVFEKRSKTVSNLH